MSKMVVYLAVLWAGSVCWGVLISHIISYPLDVAVSFLVGLLWGLTVALVYFRNN